MNVTQAVLGRHAVRAFKPDPVAVSVVRELIETAKRAPSGGNLQPWRVYALGGEPLARFKSLIAGKLAAGVRGEPPEYAVYPPNLWEPLRTRRREAGARRYAALGATRSDEHQRQLEAQNYAFFGAPVGLFFCLDRRVGPPQWADVGMYMQTLMLLAVEHGLGTCPQEVWSNWPVTITEFLRLPDDHMVFAGMSLGYEDTGHAMNAYRTDREPFENFADMVGF
jgi:nitroreductase